MLIEDSRLSIRDFRFGLFPHPLAETNKNNYEKLARTETGR
jgi:hypothetical protein